MKNVVEPEICIFYTKEDFDNVENIGKIVRVIEFPMTITSMIFEGKIGEKYGFMTRSMTRDRLGKSEEGLVIDSFRFEFKKLSLSDDNATVLPIDCELIQYRPGSEGYDNKLAMIRKLYRGI